MQIHKSPELVLEQIRVEREREQVKKSIEDELKANISVFAYISIYLLLDQIDSRGCFFFSFSSTAHLLSAIAITLYTFFFSSNYE